jgi:hypothetical protein
MASPIAQNSPSNLDEAAPVNHDSETGTGQSDPEQPTEPSGPPEKGAGASPGPPPNGGLIAWLQVVAGFFIFFNSWGILSTFPVFQTYYESGELFEASSANISWIGSI